MRKALNMRTPHKTAALAVAGVYLLLAVLAFAVMFMAGPDESLAGIFVVVVALPWSMMMDPVIGLLGGNQAVITAIMMIDVIINAGLLYVITSWITKAVCGRLRAARTNHEEGHS